MVLIRRALLALWVLPVVLGSSASAAGVSILRDDGSTVRGTLVALTESEVVWRGADGALDSMPTTACVAVVADRVRSVPVQDAGVLVLADGQRLPGRIGLMDGRLTWRHGVVGELLIDVERLRSMSLVADATAPEATTADILTLANGDRVDGIVASLGASIVVEPLTGDGAPMDVPLERVISVSLVAPEAPTDGVRVWLADGSILRTDLPRIGDDGLARLRAIGVDASEPVLTMPVEAINGILLQPAAVVPLATLTPDRLTGPVERFHLPPPTREVRRTRQPAPLELDALLLRGPIAVRYQLPEAGMRLLATAEIPPASRHWGDLELVIRSDEGGELLRVSLDGESPSEPVDVVIPGRSFTIELLEGRNGPVQDTLRLDRPMLMSNRP